jgi:hypothetical protein
LRSHAIITSKRSNAQTPTDLVTPHDYQWLLSDKAK